MKEVTSLKYCGWISTDCPHIFRTDSVVTCDSCKKERDKQRQREKWLEI